MDTDTPTPTPKTTISKYVEQIESHVSFVDTYISLTTLENWYPLKPNIYLAYNTAIPLLGMYPREMGFYFHQKGICKHFYSA